MVTNITSLQQAERERLYGGKIVAENAAYEDYLRGEYGTHAEWVNGVVIEMSPIEESHDALSRFGSAMFDTYLELTTGGRVLQDPMVMKPAPHLPGRQPDLQVLLPDRMHLLRPTEVAGAANLVVEIVSQESIKRDRGDKFEEYEQGGVEEYWIVDRIHKEALFYVRGEDGLFRSRLPVDGVYTSHVLPRLHINVSIFWQDSIPSTREAVKMVEAMLKEG
ncbi:MAG: Uma2 family endonuclease [Chloroflexi bacterium]|nr:Uma2 family endonuclease [Chloroflexota bacterium]MCC6895939.1 Uma2 family endonuclease [Anaerolineae bacterium]